MQHCRTDSATPGGLLHSPTAAPPPPPSPPAPAVSRFHTHVPVFRRAAGAHRVSALFGFGKGSSEKSEKELEKEEQFRKQQEVLARRRTNSWQAEVVDRRKEVSKYLQNPEYRKQVDAEKRARFKAKKEQEEKENPIPKFGIIVPLAPFGMPDYDETERFDLRLPFVDFGDPDPELENDPLGLKQLGKAFGFGKKKEGK
ncbi:expressed protein [Chlorella variabilis]|uniref:Expressed protein n=1 Tax=Chlorella variabilis TaxID=554065 RepID=E1ZI80_CHLVA|nr:expressed protein [Chlorella variabilis]EFN54592.1 expressed protein [Chlorella variabilis]|eukprot:XP_005846694.1 expressed protein [Chlorella variabilis]